MNIMEDEMTEQKDLFPRAHKDLVLVTLDNYEKELNEKIQKALDVITKKKTELEEIGNDLQALRLAKKYVTAEMAAETDPFEVDEEIPTSEQA